MQKPPGQQGPSPFGTLQESAARSSAQNTSSERFRHSTYLVRRKLLKLVGAAFYVDDPAGNVVLYANQKGFKLKEDIRLYTGEDMQVELLTIKARNWLDISAVYDVHDATNGEKVGALKRKGVKSMIQDEWVLLDVQEREIGTIKEESLVLALIRRFIDLASFFLPQKYNATIGDREVATFKQSKNPFLIKIEVDFSSDSSNLLDRRLGLAAAIMISAIEGKQH